MIQKIVNAFKPKAPQKHGKKNTWKERGNSFVFVLVLFPTIMVAFGFAVDIAIQNGTVHSLQQEADASSQSVLSQSQNAYRNNQPGLSSSQALKNFIKIYDANRKATTNNSSNNPFLECQGTKAVYGSTSYALASNCGFVIKSFSYTSGSNGTIKVSLQEKSHTVFLGFAQKYDLTYNISTYSRLGASFR